jgi:hypothetical protein
MTNIKVNVKTSPAKAIKTWVSRCLNLVIAISLALVGISVINYITLPEVVTKFVGYLLIVSAVVYIYRNLK